jgi:phosphoglucosamine mutase
MKYFGTDGIRDRVRGPLLEPSFVFRLGCAMGRWIRQSPASASRHVAIGRDTRSSAGYLFLALARGLHKEGIRIFDAGVCPTPAVSRAVRDLELDAGIVITASHNPASDNGIKLFGPGGFKLSENEEELIEDLLDTIPALDEDPALTPPVRYYEARRHYLDGYRSLLPQQSLMGLRIVLDCSHGATFHTSGELLEHYGARVVSLACEPTGENINEGVGSEHPEVMCGAVRQHQADLGIAHDGDGDRVILCDAKGRVIDGDAVLAILAAGWAGRGALPHSAVVATVMSNLGLDNCLREAGVRVERVGVGDRQVFYAMRAGGYVLGGESSGHFIAMNHLPTGDGLLAALLVLAEMLAADRPLAELASRFQPFPQILKNLPVKHKLPLDSLPDLQAGLAGLSARLGQRGRILLRYSGTEPKIRLLAEAEDESLVAATLEELESLVHAHLPIARSVFP